MVKVFLVQMVLFFIFAAGIVSGTEMETLIKSIDDQCNKGIAEHYKKSGMETLKMSLDLCLEALKKHPDNYELLWRGARSAGEYAEAAMIIKMDGWQDICKKWGKVGMDLAGKAQEINPDRVEGYFWQIQTIGKYSDASSFITALREGFLSKMRQNLAKSYEIDNAYHDYGPVFVNAIFHYELPWPMKDKEKAISFYEEFREKSSWQIDSARRHTFSAKLLLNIKGKDHKEEARKLLETVVSDPNPRLYFYEQATEMMKKAK